MGHFVCGTWERNLIVTRRLKLNMGNGSYDHQPTAQVTKMCCLVCYCQSQWLHNPWCFSFIDTKLLFWYDTAMLRVENRKLFNEGTIQVWFMSHIYGCLQHYDCFMVTTLRTLCNKKYTVTVLKTEKIIMWLKKFIKTTSLKFQISLQLWSTKKELHE
jgi:hypothetical protein